MKFLGRSSAQRMKSYKLIAGTILVLALKPHLLAPVQAQLQRIMGRAS
jgi:hypothetical protein